jgi:hypothetical protein
MHVQLRGDDLDAPAWGDLGLHIHWYGVAINTEADSGYLALEGSHAALYRLRRDGLRIHRDPVDGGTVERDDKGKVEARWWPVEAVGAGTYQALVPPQVAYVAIDDAGRFWWFGDEAREAVDDLLGDYPREDDPAHHLPFPDDTIIGWMAADIPTAIDAR